MKLAMKQEHEALLQVQRQHMLDQNTKMQSCAIENHPQNRDHEIAMILPVA